MTLPGDKLSWYWNRLHCMSPSEMMHRAHRGARAHAERWGSFRADVVPSPSLSRSSNPWWVSVSVPDPGRYSRAAEAILNGRMRLLELQELDLGPVPRWNKNPQSGHDAPMSFGKLLDYRDKDFVGNIKYIWILNRHTHLVTLAQAYYLDRDERWLQGVALHLRSWMDECPYPTGPNWSSSLELGIRLINWSLVWHLMGGLSSPLFAGREGLDLRDRWIGTIYRHAHFIQGNLSRFSSANNHLLGEAAGLFLATVTWPFWTSFERWQRVAHEELTREMSRQVTPDGVHREQSIFYQKFVLDFGILAGLAGRANDVEFPGRYWDRIEAMLDYLSSVMDVGGNVPMIGDSDDSPAVHLSQEETFSDHRSLLALGAVLFSRAELKVKSGRIDDKVIWLLGDEAKRIFDDIEVKDTNLPVRLAFPEGGYYILGSDLETKDEIKLIVDAGPLGYLSLAAHGHADALAFTLSVGGNEFLIDPGTYAYRSNPKWRNYFRGTSAHNTIRVDEEDQSVIGGDFMWLGKASAKCEHWETGAALDRFAGSHDGYRRLRDPVIHRREISFFKNEARIRIEDTIECSDLHLIERFWHFSEYCAVSRHGTSIAAEQKGARMRLDVSEEDAEIELLRGQQAPPAGWVSRRFAVRAPTSTVCCRNRIEGTAALVTEIEIEL